MKIAIVEDDKLLALNIWKKLKRNWYEVIISNSISEFKTTILDNADLFILDIGLWDWEWFEIVKWLREIKNKVEGKYIWRQEGLNVLSRRLIQKVVGNDK